MSLISSLPNLPVRSSFAPLAQALRDTARAVLVAPPGAGKTTLIPLALLEENWLAGKRILLLEPRRLAARAVAARMAGLLGEPVGETVGYRVRLESRVGPRTRIEVVTEGVLTRRLQDDPSLDDVGLLIFDEFHERSLQADLGLALALEAREALRPDLRLLVMSATLDAAGVSRLLDGAPVIESAGRAYPVEVRYWPPRAGQREDEALRAAVRRVLIEETGSVLVFLPGEGEIRRLAEALETAGLPADVDLHPLYGRLGLAEQDAAIRPAPAGRRKLVLSTAIAQTSLTIEGVRVVVDAGLSRQAHFDPASGMSRLVTRRVSRAASVQRAGRAGRLEPGVCVRLWSESEQERLAAADTPEILQADLAPLVLELAEWGASEVGTLRWMDPPPPAALGQARALLQALGALDADGRLSVTGRHMARLPLHPRLARLLVHAREAQEGETAAWAGLAVELAGLLSERDPWNLPSSDIALRLDALARGEGGARALGHLREVIRHLAQAAGIDLSRPRPRGIDRRVLGPLLALAYPDRIAQRREGSEPRFRLSGGRGAVLPREDALASCDWLVVAQLDGEAREARIRLAAELDIESLVQALPELCRETTCVHWDARELAVKAVRRRLLGELVIEERALAAPPAEAVCAALIEGLRQAGPTCLPWTDTLRRWQARLAFVRARQPDAGWPALDDESLMAGLEDWFPPWSAGLSRLAHLARLDLSSALRERLDWAQRQALERLAPEYVEVPSGSRLRLDYGPEGVSLSVRLQEMFGQSDTPRVLDGREPVTLHLLSPARRPVQVTRDLAGFWRGSYAEVKKELKGRYPKHDWPDDPLHAAPSRGAKRKA